MSANGSVQEPAVIEALGSAERCGAPDPYNARAGTHRIMQAGTLVWGGVREDRPHEEDGRRQQQRQCLNGSHDRPSLSRASVVSSLPARVGDEHARGAESEGLSGRTCRSGHSASSAPPEEPRQDKRPHRDQEARRRAGYAVNQIAGRCAEHRAEHEGFSHDVHGHSTEQAAFQGASVCLLAGLRAVRRAVRGNRLPRCGYGVA